MRILGLILAGGESRRMGRDKALVPLQGRPMIAHVIERLSPQVSDLAISANGDAGRFGWTGLPVLPDDTPMGPLSGILSGLIWARSQGATALVSAPCDGPIFPGDLVPRLCLAAEGHTGALAMTRDLHPTWGLWTMAQLAPLAAFLASGATPRLRDFASAAGRATWPEGAFVNANAPADLAAIEARA